MKSSGRSHKEERGKPGRVNEYRAGPGTYVRGAYIYASVLGPKEEQQADPGGDDKPFVMVSQPRRARATDQVIQVGDIVMARVTRISTRQASVEIICVGETVLREPHRGIVKKEDIRATEIDKAQVALSLRPGDIIRARVISLGDSTHYFLSTAENELGVRWAKSSAGSIMIPISWQEMQCPTTKEKEPRKCAKPV
ncbi:unnamed protein product [Ascophyllum nodosum]